MTCRSMLLALLGLLFCLMSISGFAKEPDKQKPKKVISPEPTVELVKLKARKELLQKAQHWLVPRPHPKSKLVKIWVFQSSSTDFSDPTDFYALGFVEPGKPHRALAVIIRKAS